MMPKSRAKVGFTKKYAAKSKKAEGRWTYPLFVYNDEKKKKLVNPLLFVIELPMPRYPSLSL